jgi:hypothetical protein
MSISPSFSVSPSISPSPSAGYAEYSRGVYATLPLNDNNLSTLYSAGDVATVATDDTNRVIQAGTLQYMVHQFKNFVGTETKRLVFSDLQSSLAPSASPIVLEIYNRVTTTWVELVRNDVLPANIDFSLTKNVMDLSAYKDASNVISCRIWQLAT